MLSHIEANELLDVYGELLTSRQLEILELYYREDLSYSEISEELKISRAAIQDSVRKSINQLKKYESVVQYIEKRNKVFECLEQGQIERIQEIL